MIQFIIGLCLINTSLILIFLPIKIVERLKEKKAEKEELEHYKKY